jgi:hypothetical protein
MFKVKTTKRSKLYIKERSATFFSSRPVPVTFTRYYFSRSKYKVNESWLGKETRKMKKNEFIPWMP